MENGRTSSGTKKLALGGMLLALTVITLFFATILPTNRLSLYALSSFFVSILIIEFGVKIGWVFYFSSCLLAFVIVQNKVGLIPYAMFFGVYGILKYYIEKLNKLIPEYLLKLVFFNLFLMTAFVLTKEILLGDIEINMPLWIIIPVTEVIFIIYDYVYTLFVQYYNTKLKKLLRI